MILTGKYCGDAKMASLLKKYEVEFTLHQLYGLLYGAVSAPEIVQPSQVISIIFQEKDPVFETKDDASSFFGNVMALWNVVVKSTSGKATMVWPKIVFQQNDAGLKEYIHAVTLLTEQFIKGLDLGAPQKEDFSCVIIYIHHPLTNPYFLLKEYVDL